MANFFDQFDKQEKANFFDQFDENPVSEPVSDPLPPAERLATQMIPGSEFVFGVAKGLQTAKSGAEQLVGDTGAAISRALGDEEAAAEAQAFSEAAQAEITERDRQVEELGLLGKGGALVGEVAPSAVLPGGPTGGLARRIAGGVATDVLSSVADPVREDQTRAGNLQAVATGSAALRGTGGLISKIADKFAGARAGNFKDVDVKDLVKNADAQEISLFLDDATQAPFAQKASVAAEVFGIFGTAPGRRRQGQEALEAAERWLQKYAGDVDNYAEIVQSGLQRKLNIFRRAAAKKYDRVSRTIAQNGGASQVTTNAFDDALDAGIAAETAKGGRANAQVLKILEDYKASRRGTFDDMIELRSDLNKDIAALYRGESPPNHTATQVLGRVQDAIDQDMETFARRFGADAQWRAANDFYQNTVVQFKKGKLKALTKPDSAGNFDEQAAWRYLTQNSTNPTRARRMWQSLDAEGRAAVRAGVISEALEAATREGAPFSPARFAGNLEKRMPVIEQFFRGRSGEELKGLVRVMRHIERAGQFAENPPTGNRLIQFLLAGGALIEPGTVAGGVGAASGIRQLFQTRTGRDLFLTASKTTPGTAEFSRLLEKLERIAARSISQEQSTP